MVVKNFKRIFNVFVFTVFLLSMSSPLLAHHEEGKAYDLSDEVYTVLELTEAKKYNAAKEKLNQIVVALDTGHLSVSKQKLDYVYDITHNTIRHLESDIQNDELKMDKVLSFVLMMESVQNPNSQMVSAWEDRLTEQIQVGLESETTELKSEFSKTMDFYSVIYPAWKAKQSTELWEELDEQFINLNNVNNEEDMLNALHVMQKTVDQLQTEQPTDSKEDDDASFGWLIISVGGVIVFTLMYVGWRKYKGEKKQEKVKKVDDL
ncbi:sporulation protein YpjB [Salinibacillus xinjiangensis]|uniref:Sporulation protein YpjB n=1 Tax=Salinibacillus xinjiangensis TaxID=1229268 RepID=A0A6G1X619_9BACI|nr:sporulation protein YpjB [Salinibacillus xinjiangensis]MRG86387.1 hypothetical protein [Salinibacillus xinjiangensis]